MLKNRETCHHKGKKQHTSVHHSQCGENTQNEITLLRTLTIPIKLKIYREKNVEIFFLKWENIH